MEKITVEVIAHKEFTISSKGYNQAEVDNFLDDICEELERMEKEITELRQKTTMVHPAAPAPAASSSGACAIATPWGVAKNTRSQSLSGAEPGSLKASLTRPRRDGYISETGIPVSLREVIARSSTSGCWASRRSSSTPV